MACVIKQLPASKAAIYDVSYRKHGHSQRPRDRRARQICLTDRARDLQDPATDAAQDQNRVALAGLSGDEQQQLIDLMQRVITAMLRD